MTRRPQDLLVGLVKPILLDGYSELQLSEVGGGYVLM